ncbi:MAG: AraC family transcriptional regulator [Gammaproteobacteria bacterium]|jgi:AraC-like DNA-binding protein|uniref:AraC-type DNA-binding protein n=1 Tax=Marinomonas polaris DSM 16579 TaxID=1122206 RepID=A0A1M5I8R4_9GAMM|nr:MULTISPECIES: AraC family transcriptional regulator [Marinomonas]MBU1468547.1 AraC family transcriptional regulator [Gammaproteobacteria bacterium]MBU2023544.1 AraC family transcriptional regulator [Gammaproteobacteria bacterium]MBU2240081.1 AraC family transcriptional regulator [Gammaproteobacteria bacterium]MBU2317317.1 AraC family transcriptional regulator [Gammaproteobacteria bacterium]MBU2412372.1 AraC family transcriptional regulator [Gammaproteobacteria bacterium]
MSRSISTEKILLQHKRAPVQLVENRVCFAGPHSELSIYDTYEQAQKVSLKADSLLYCGMVTGAKVMHTKEHDNIPFLPHESFILAPKEEVFIDFPEAQFHRPTTCLTIAISQERVAQICDRMNDIMVESLPSGVALDPNQHLHTLHTQATQQVIDRLTSDFLRNDPDRDLLVDFGVSELVTRIIRHHGRDALLRFTQRSPDANGLTCVIQCIEQNLAQPLDINQLAKMACMSRSRFYESFKRQLGCTPLEYQHQRRMSRAYQRLQEKCSVTEVSYELGYLSLSHFSRRFHQHFGMSPRQATQTQLNS